ncbi:MAG: polyribonucleotide nucleotidyltransferase [Rickettsiales bacterium]|nr:polyribonucleotide nucleotidyltransferase [Rickettsiales bacterium]
MKVLRKEIKLGEQTIILEAGKIAQQADGAVVATCGETTILATAVFKKDCDQNADFFPLTVSYREMAFAAGKIPGGFFKREGRPSERETIISRLIDRPIRPLFPDGFLHDVQVICTVLSYDGKNDSDTLAMIAASAALSISGVPFNGPIAALRVGMIDDEFVINPPISQYKDLKLDLVIAGTDKDILMVESEAHELSEEKILEALKYGQKNLHSVIKAIEELKAQIGKSPFQYEASKEDTDLQKQIEKIARKSLEDAYTTALKKERGVKLHLVKAKVLEQVDLEMHSKSKVLALLKNLQESVVRNNILAGKRIDGRGLTSIRNVDVEVGILPRTHGSALFNRGETQAIVVATLGSIQDEQMIDSLDGESRDHFMLHYNFPSYSVGEVSPLRGPGRREIGHGRLASRAIRPMLPQKEDFPYTIRVVSEITACNGSSSMATVCGASLSMMDAGVPLKRPVAGVAMGLIKLDTEFHILSDIIGDEDALGDMDFKVAGTVNGITALQMDIKVAGISHDIMKHALSQAREGRIHILDIMNQTLSSNRETLNKHAPQITKIALPKHKIGEVIGPGGKNIKEICEVSGATVDINDEGVAFVSAVNQESSAKAIEMIKSIIEEPEIGKVYDGVVKATLDFGAIVRFMGKREGLVHISEMSEEKVAKVTDMLKEGDSVKVKVLEIDSKKGRVRLTLRLNTKENNDPQPKKQEEEAPKKKMEEKQPKQHKAEEKTEHKTEHKAGTKKYFNT